jgi:hypothetical protein
MNRQFVPDTDSKELTKLTDDFKRTAARLMYRMLDNLDIEARRTIVRLQDEAGWRIGLEIAADVYGQYEVAMTGISLDGTRKVFASIAEGSPSNAH